MINRTIKKIISRFIGLIQQRKPAFVESISALFMLRKSHQEKIWGTALAISKSRHYWTGCILFGSGFIKAT